MARDSQRSYTGGRNTFAHRMSRLLHQRWFLYPPDKEPHFHPNMSTLWWLRDVYPRLPSRQAAPMHYPERCSISRTASGTPR
ncbi:jmjC domain-containing protein 8-like isoform X2 [Vanacampus margaritifer]